MQGQGCLLIIQLSSCKPNELYDIDSGHSSKAKAFSSVFANAHFGSATKMSKRHKFGALVVGAGLGGIYQ